MGLQTFERIPIHKSDGQNNFILHRMIFNPQKFDISFIKSDGASFFLSLRGLNKFINM